MNDTMAEAIFREQSLRNGHLNQTEWMAAQQTSVVTPRKRIATILVALAIQLGGNGFSVSAPKTAPAPRAAGA